MRGSQKTLMKEGSCADIIFPFSSFLRFAPANLNPQPEVPGYGELVDRLAADDRSRISFLKACLSELGLEVAQDDYTPPSLSGLHLTAIDSGKVTELLCDLGDAIEKENGNELIRAEADTFQIVAQDDGVDLSELRNTLPQAETIDDPSLVIKKIIPHENKLPSDDLTPRFSHERFYSSLRHYRKIESGAYQWGDVLLYGDVVTSTNTLLEKCVPPLPLLSIQISPQQVLICRDSEIQRSTPNCRQVSPLLPRHKSQDGAEEPTSGSHPQDLFYSPSSSTTQLTSLLHGP